MSKRLSREFYIIVAAAVLIFVFFFLYIPVRRAAGNIFQNDSSVIKDYYGALNRRDYSKAYGYLVDLSFRYKAPNGEAVDFDIRPDYQKYVDDHEKIEKIRILSIKKESKHDYPEVGLRCFRVESVIKYRDVILPSGGKTLIYIYTLNTGKKPLILGIRTTP